jgi:hypothetical protein
MEFTVNIYDSGAARPSSAPLTDTLTPFDAGPSAALGPVETLDATTLALAIDRAIDAGPPSAELMQTVEAGLMAGGSTTADVTASSGGVSAGAAPA